MLSQKIFRSVMVIAFVIALAGVGLVTYAVTVGDPFASEDTSDDPEDIDEYKDDGGKGPLSSDDDHDDDDDDLAAAEDEDGAQEKMEWALPVMAISAIMGMFFTGLSADLYMRSRRGENMVRMDLLDLITVNPGINLSSIRRELQLSQGAVSYHIMKLEKSGKILSDKGSKERRYYPSSMGYTAAMNHARMDEMESILSNETSTRIVELLRDGPMSQNQIVRELDISPSTVHWHMERMKKAGMVSKEHRGRSVYYELGEIPVRNT